MRPGEVRHALARRKALALTLLSLTLWGTWSVVRDAGHPYRDLLAGYRTDHFSHMNTARLFTHAGLDIWRKPLRDSARPLSPDEQRRLPRDIAPALEGHGEVYGVPGWPADKPFISSWSHNPRFHPPGALLLTAPVAIPYHFTGLSFTDANRLLILLFLAYVHIALFFFIQAATTTDRMRPMGFLVLFAVYFEVIHFALEGFYEGVVIAPLLLCGRALLRRRALPAIAWFTVAANLHFRAYFFAPLAVYAAYVLLEERQWRTWKRGEWMLAAGTAAMAVSSLGVFRLLWPYLRSLPASNRHNVTIDPMNVAAVTTLAILVGAAIVAFVVARAWMDAAIAAWVGLMATLLRETLAWDMLTLFAWLGLPVVAAAHRLPLVRDARIVTIAVLSFLVFGNVSLFAPAWLQRIFT